ncbi:hypothetical protein TNCV_763651 [Trichonephila clavipes]|nr:hypothetical protein TNCV_763651 [Trichonephila clavipes]
MMGDFTYAEKKQTCITCNAVQLVTAELRYECITRSVLFAECWITGFSAMGEKYLSDNLPEGHIWGAMDWAWWTSPLATPISRFIVPRLLFKEASEESYLCDST